MNKTVLSFLIGLFTAKAVMHCPVASGQTVSTFAPAVLVPAHSTWKYRAASEVDSAAWKGQSYDDAAWRIGRGEFGYGEGDETTVVASPPPPGMAFSVYFRKAFNAPLAGSPSGLILRLKRDDGVVVYINGEEVFRDNLPEGGLAGAVLATREAEDDGQTFLEHPLRRGLLMPVDNLIAVEIHQAAAGTGDMSFDLELIASQQVDVEFHRSGPDLLAAWSSEAGEGVAFEQSAMVSGPWQIAQSQPTAAPFQRAMLFTGVGRELFLRRVSCDPPWATFPSSELLVEPNQPFALIPEVGGSLPNAAFWRKNGIFLGPLPGLFPGYEEASAGRGNGGAFDLFLANACDCAFSDPVAVRVGGLEATLRDHFFEQEVFEGFSGSANGWNQEAERDPFEPLHPSSPWGRTLWAFWIAPASGIVEFKTAGSAQQTALAVYRGENLVDLQLEASANPDPDQFFNAHLRMNAEQGVRYSIMVDGDAMTGSVCLDWSLEETQQVVPQILVQPMDRSAMVGSTVAFEVVAKLPPRGDTQRINYQWYAGSKLITNATGPTLVLSNVQPVNAELYKAVLRTQEQEVLTHHAALTVSLVSPQGVSLNSTNVSSGITWIPSGSFTGSGACGGSAFPRYRLLCFTGPASVNAVHTGVPAYVDPNFYGPLPATGYSGLLVSTRHCENIGLDTAITLTPLPTSLPSCQSRCVNLNNSTICTNAGANARYLEEATTPLCPNTTQVRAGIMYRLLGATGPTQVKVSWNYY